MAAPTTAQTFGFRRPVLTVLLLSFLLRLPAAFMTELGNDEVYYLLYARFPDWSHFDHPSMIGWIIQFFTLDFRLSADGFLRLPALVLGTANLFLLYRISEKISGHRTAIVALLLGSASIYVSVLTGVFILPDTPQIFFWLLALVFLIDTLPARGQQPAENLRLLLAGAAMGAALLSKYHSVFLPFGVVVFVLLYDRGWFKRWSFYGMLLLAAAGLLPTLWWNYANDFITFSFQGGRVVPEEWSINHNTFLQEILGEVLYQNPIVFVAIWAGIFTFRKQFGKRPSFPKEHFKLLLWIALPLLLVFISFSLFRRTLPHWTGPAYVTLIPLAADWVRQRAHRSVPRSTLIANALLLIVLILGPIQINTGMITLDQGHREVDNWHRDDATLDMTGWKALGDSLRMKLPEYKDSPDQRVVLTSSGWFPSAHIDHYVARPNDLEFVALGKPRDIHKFWWVNATIDSLQPGDLVLFVSDSRNHRSVDQIRSMSNVDVDIIDTLRIDRSGLPAKYVFIHRFRGVPKVSAYPNP